MTSVDVIGVGALKLDYLVRGPSTVLAPFGLTVEAGTEQRLDEAAVRTVGRAVESLAIDTVTGGSAFNTVHALARMEAGLRLGYVGVAGRGVSSVRLFALLGIDRRYVFREDDHLCGICFSFADGDDRTLLTHEGANQFMADYIDHHFDELVAYLSSSRIVHLTSFLDGRTVQRLLALVRAVKLFSPETLISFDPGHAWSTSGSPEVHELVGLSDLVLVNRREFAALDPATDQHVTVVVKQPDGIRVRDDFYPQVPLPAEEIVDGTGAGDVFAAGLLAALARDPTRFEDGARLGMLLARHKLRHSGTDGHDAFAEIVRTFA